MANKPSPELLESLLRLLGRYPHGATLSQIATQVYPNESRLRIARALEALVAQHRIRPTGLGWWRRYHPTFPGASDGGEAAGPASEPGSAGLTCPATLLPPPVTDPAPAVGPTPATVPDPLPADEAADMSRFVSDPTAYPENSARRAADRAEEVARGAAKVEPPASGLPRFAWYSVKAFDSRPEEDPLAYVMRQIQQRGMERNGAAVYARMQAQMWIMPMDRRAFLAAIDTAFKTHFG